MSKLGKHSSRAQELKLNNTQKSDSGRPETVLGTDMEQQMCLRSSWLHNVMIIPWVLNMYKF